MEKIQVELNTVDNLDVEDAQPEPCKFHDTRLLVILYMTNSPSTLLKFKDFTFRSS